MAYGDIKPIYKTKLKKKSKHPCCALNMPASSTTGQQRCLSTKPQSLKIDRNKWLKTKKTNSLMMIIICHHYLQPMSFDFNKQSSCVSIPSSHSYVHSSFRNGL